MAVLGFTTVGSLLKDQSELVKAKGLDAFGVTVIDDAEGKHEIIKTSNAQLHLFMQLKRGNVTHMLFQSAEQAEIFFANIEAYYGKEKADGIMSNVKFMSLEDARSALESRGIKDISELETFENAISSLI